MVVGLVLVLGGIGMSRITAEQSAPGSGVSINFDGAQVDRLIGILEKRVAPASEAEDARMGGFLHFVQEIFTAGLIAEGTSTLATTTVTQFEASGEATLSSNLYVSGESDLSRMIQGGSVLGVNTASTTLTAANVCNNSFIWHEATSTSDQPVNTMTSPATTTLYADCLKSNGKFISLLYYNATSSDYGASTTFAEGVGVELKISSDSGGSATVLPQEMARLILTRVTDVTSTLEVQVLADGD